MLAAISIAVSRQQKDSGPLLCSLSGKQRDDPQCEGRRDLGGDQRRRRGGPTRRG